MLSYIWLFMMAAAVLCGICFGTLDKVSAATMEGARAAVELCLSIAGPMVLWSGIMQILSESGLTAKLARVLSPLLLRVLGPAGKDPEIMEAVGANVSANLLGVGNAATPPGLKAAEMIAERFGRDPAPDALCRLVVMNSASIQLIPMTIASIRGGMGCETPFDIIPAVWMASSAALIAGLSMAWLLRRVSSAKKQ